MPHFIHKMFISTRHLIFIKYYILWLILFMIVPNLKIKAQNSDECKYLTVLLYLHTNDIFLEKSKNFYPNFIKKKANCIKFNIDQTIRFIDFQTFENQLKNKNYISQEFIKSNKLYYEKYFFEPFESNFLKNIVSANKSNLFITFSKPIENYLLIEISHINPELNPTGRKTGKSMFVFFKFHSDGKIEDVLYSGAVYN